VQEIIIFKNIESESSQVQISSHSSHERTLKNPKETSKIIKRMMKQNEGVFL